MVKGFTQIPDADTLLGQRFRWDLTDSYEVGSLLMLIRFTTWKRTSLRELLSDFIDEDYEFGEVLDLSSLTGESGNPRLLPCMVDSEESGDGKQVLATFQFKEQMDEPTPDFLTDCIPWLQGVAEKYSVNVECNYTYIGKPSQPVAFGYWEVVRRAGKAWIRQGHVPAI